MGTELRRYQLDALAHLHRRIHDEWRRLYIDLPTGTGKSTIAAAFAAQRLEETHGRVLALVHRQDLVRQLAQTFRREGLEVGLLMEGERALHAPVVVATVQSLTLAAMRDLLAAHPDPLLTALIDEAHHAVPGSAYQRALTTLDDAAGSQPVTAVGFTATPYRSDTRSMLDVLPVCAFARSIPEMVQEGWLAPLTWKPVRVDLDLEQVVITYESGERDYAEATLARHLLHETITTRLVEHAAALIGKRPTLVFAASVQHAEHLAAAFGARGFSAAVVSGDTSAKQREAIYADWRSGAIQVVCNCSLLTEGFDFPALAALVIARPTLSPSLYMQMLGRGMRKAEGKSDCLVIDVLGNQPDPRRQVVLPHVVGIDEAAAEGERSAGRPAGSRRTDPVLRAILGGQGEMGLALLDPLGRSQYRWTAYRRGYFARVNAEVIVIVESDPDRSGLYRSRQYTQQPEPPGEHHWIERRYLPLRQQVALVHEATRDLFREAFAGKEAAWLEQPASEKQLKKLRHYNRGLAEQARTAGWTQREASEAITFYERLPVLFRAPDEGAGGTRPR